MTRDEALIYFDKQLDKNLSKDFLEYWKTEIVPMVSIMQIIEIINKENIINLTNQALITSTDDTTQKNLIDQAVQKLVKVQNNLKQEV